MLLENFVKATVLVDSTQPYVSCVSGYYDSVHPGTPVHVVQLQQLCHTRVLLLLAVRPRGCTGTAVHGPQTDTRAGARRARVTGRQRKRERQRRREAERKDTAEQGERGDAQLELIGQSKLI